MRDCRINLLNPADIKMLRDRKAGSPGAANNRRKYLSSMLGNQLWLMRSNPVREVRRLRHATSGFHAWTIEEVRQFEARHPVGASRNRCWHIALLNQACFECADHGFRFLGDHHEQHPWNWWLGAAILGTRRIRT